MNPDTERLKLLQDYYAEYRSLPSYAGIAELACFKSKNAAVKLVNRLKAGGLLESAPGGRLVPTSAFFARPLVGSAPAGFASPAYEVLQDAITIDEYLVEHPASTVLVEVQGESMINAGINDKDILVVERKANPSVDRIVVAIVDGDFTIKYLRRDQQGYYLEPANERFTNIRPQGELEIYGEVVGQFRKMR